jgi:hypothetical protein
MPVTQYFQAGTFFFAAPTTEKDDDEDLFKVPQFPATPYSYKKVKQNTTLHLISFTNHPRKKVFFFHQL